MESLCLFLRIFRASNTWSLFPKLGTFSTIRLCTNPTRFILWAISPKPKTNLSAKALAFAGAFFYGE
jgi:hypothetical protein